MGNADAPALLGCLHLPPVMPVACTCPHQGSVPLRVGDRCSLNSIRSGSSHSSMLRSSNSVPSSGSSSGSSRLSQSGSSKTSHAPRTSSSSRQSCICNGQWVMNGIGCSAAADGERQRVASVNGQRPALGTSLSCVLSLHGGGAHRKGITTNKACLDACPSSARHKASESAPTSTLPVQTDEDPHTLPIQVCEWLMHLHARCCGGQPPCAATCLIWRPWRRGLTAAGLYSCTDQLQ